MPLPTIRRISRRLRSKTKSWGTVVALTLAGNKVQKKTELHHCKNPVLLLYGFGATRRTFAILEKRLHNDGFPVFSINLGGIFGTFNTDAIEDLALHIDKKIERMYLKYKFRGKISIIAHSKGGLIGSYYIKKLSGDKRTKLLLTMGTPHNGNPWALWALFSPAALILKSVRQMTPISDFIKRLKAVPYPKSVMVYSIFSKDDRVSPYPMPVLDDASNVRNVEIDGISHSEFLIKKSVYHVINHALKGQMPVSLEERTREKISMESTAPLGEKIKKLIPKKAILKTQKA